MKIFLIKIIKTLAQRIFSILWRLCIPFELLKLKLRFKDYQISYLRKGNGEMFKVILRSPDRQSLLLKKDNKLTEFWGYLNSHFHISQNKPTHHNFQDKADVLEGILQNIELKKLTLLVSVNRKKKEYFQQYCEDAIDLNKQEYKHEHKKIEEILELFLSHGMTSYDHSDSNFIYIKDALVMVDLESVQWTQKIIS